MYSRILGAVLMILALAAVPDRATGQAPESLRQLSHSLYEITQELTPAVVQILSNSYASVLDDSETGAPVALRQSTGSGAILSPDGLIVTNASVVSGATRVRVRLSFADQARGRSILRPSGKLLPAKIVYGKQVNSVVDIELLRDGESLTKKVVIQPRADDPVRFASMVCSGSAGNGESVLPVRYKERTHEEATEALHAGRESRHPEAAFAGQGADLEALR